MKSYPSKELIKMLQNEGWEIDRQKGSHIHLTKNGMLVTIPHPRKDLTIGLVKAIIKSTGLAIK